MNLRALALLTLLILGCGPQRDMRFPSQHELNCEPFGRFFVTIHSNEEEGVTDEIALTARSEVLSNWHSIWSATAPLIDECLVRYKYGHTLSELIRMSGNKIVVMIEPPEQNERYRLDVRIDLKQEDGWIVFGVDFQELTPLKASATF